MLYLARKQAEGWKNAVAHQRTLWICALGVSFLVSVFAIFRGGYIGPDYNFHLARLLDTRRIFDFSLTNPPLYSLLGHGLFLLTGRNSGFPITLSVIQVAINILAVWWFFLYTECRFGSPVLHLAFVLFLTFLPVRIIHAATIGEDTTTVPLFVLLLVLFANFLAVQTSTPKNAVFLGLGLSAAVWTKYSFAALIPAIFAVLALLSWRRAWKLKQFVAICALSLALPSATVLCTYWTAQHWPRTQGHGTVAREVWLSKSGRKEPEMDYKDLFSAKVNDVELFRAPEFFRPSGGYPFGYRQPHKYSYLALSHMGVFTDTMNLFQDLRLPQNINTYLIPDFKTRRAWKSPLMTASMSLGILWTVLALIGTPCLLFSALMNLWNNTLDFEHAAVLLAIPYFLLIVLPIPFVHSAVLNGFWTPRLILPPLLCFFLAAFLLLDRKLVRRSKNLASVVLALVVVQSGIELIMLA